MSCAQVVCLTPVERALLDRCLQNDTGAFNEVVHIYQAKVYNYICRMTADAEEAEDLTQEVFVRLYTSLKTFRNQSSLNTWIFRIASNLCIDRFRRRKKQQIVAYSLDEPVENDEAHASREIADSRFEPHRLAEAAELSQVIDRALARLPDKLRAVVVLHDIEDLPYDEVAKVVGCPIGTVKSRLFHARVKMRDYLAEYVKRA